MAAFPRPASHLPIKGASIESAIPQQIFKETFIGMSDATSAETQISREAHAASEKDYKKKIERIKREAQNAINARKKSRSQAEVDQKLGQATNKADGSGPVDTTGNDTLKDLHQRVPTLERALRDYLDPHGGKASQEIVDKVIRRLLSRPDLQELFFDATLYSGGVLPADLQQRLANHLIYDSDFVTILRTNHDALFGKEFDITADPNARKAELDGAIAQRDEIKTSKDLIDTEYGQVTTELKEYERTSAKDPVGAKAHEVDEAKNVRLPIAKENVKNAQAQLKVISEELDALLAEKRKTTDINKIKNLETRIAETKQQRTEAETYLTEKLTEQRSYQDKIDSESTLLNREKALSAQQKKLDTDLKSAQTKVDRLEASFKAAEADFTAGQQNILEGFDGVIEESVEDWVNRKKVEACTEVDEFLNKKILEANQQRDDELGKNLDVLLIRIREKFTETKFKRFRDPRKPKTEIGRTFKKKKIDEAYNILFTKGDDALVDHVFRGVTLTAQQRADIKPELVRQTMRMRLSTGGVVSEVDRQFISMSTWGRTFVEEMMVRDPALAAQLTKAVGTDVNDPEAPRKVQQKAGIDPSVLMMLIQFSGQGLAGLASEERK